MNETTTRFMSAFHSLNGTTFDERKRNFSLLVNQYSFLAKTEDLDVVIRNLKPRSHLERLFWVELLIRFKRFNELLIEFRNGNDIVASKISKQRWFFERYFSELQPETFVDNVLPTLSYVLRLKILKKLLLSEEQTDQLFEAVCDKYGLLLAISILQKCSATKIREVLQNNAVSLTPRQLKCIFDKEPDLIFLYIDERKKQLDETKFLNSHPVLTYIAQNDPDFFCAIKEKYNFGVKLGNRTTKKFVQIKKNVILARPRTYIGCFQANSLVHKLGSDFESFLYKIFPQTTAYVSSSDVNNLLKYCPKKCRFTLFEKLFNKIYTPKFGDETSSITEHVLKSIYDNDERERWARIKYEEQEENKQEFLQYFKAENCLNMLMPKLGHSSNKQRKSYVKIMTRSCILSRDLDSTHKLAKLLEERFRNDTDVTEAFLSSFSECDSDLFLKSSQDLLETMMELTMRAIRNNEHTYHADLIMFRLLECLRKNNKPITDVVSKNPSVALRILLCSGNKCMRQLRELLLSELVKASYEKPGNMNETAKFHMDLAELCVDYNKVNRKQPLTVDVWQNGLLMKSCNHVMSDNIQHTRPLLTLIRLHNPPEETENMRAQFFTAKSEIFKQADMGTYLWLLKYKPRLILDHVEPFLDGIFHISQTSSLRIWNTIKKYGHLGLDRKVVDFLLMKINEGDYELSKKEKSIMPLSMLMLPEEFVKFAQTYKPVSGKATDLNDDFYKIQCKVACNLKELKIPEIILPPALYFSTGDYLRFALRPLYSAIYRTISEDKVIYYLNQLHDTNSISVKKHSLHLSCVVLDMEKGMNRLKTSTILCTIPAVKYFKNNPSPESWNIAKAVLKRTNRNGANLLKSALEITLPLSYRQEYYEMLWDISNALKQTSLNLLLISKMNFDSYDRGVKIIGSSFLKENQKEVDRFAANFMCKNDDPARFKWFANALNDFKTTAWKLSEDKGTCRNRLFHFVQNLFKIFMGHREKSIEKQREDATEIAAVFNRIFQPSEAFDEYVLVSLMKLKELPVADMSKSILELSHQIVDMFGNTALFPFAEQVNWAFYWLDHEFCHQLLELSESLEDDLLVVKMLPEYGPRTNYKNILTKLRERNNSAVNLHLALCFKGSDFEDLGFGLFD